MHEISVNCYSKNQKIKYFPNFPPHNHTTTHLLKFIMMITINSKNKIIHHPNTPKDTRRKCVLQQSFQVC